MKIVPLNNHILVRPIKHEDFIEGANSYDEMGEVLALEPYMEENSSRIKVGDIVYFDSFLVAKYPGETIDTPIWLVDCSDVRAKREKDAT